MLEAALADAQRWEFDLPADAGLKRARELFAGLAFEIHDVSSFEVDVAVDGAIGITTGSPNVSISVTVAPNGSRTDAGAVDHRKRKVIWTSENPSIEEIVREIGRAA